MRHIRVDTWLRGAKERFKSLRHGPLQPLVAMVASLQQTLKHGSLTTICVDSDGDWINRRHDITLVSPDINVTSWSELQATVADLWCHDYQPGPGDTVVDVGAGIGDEAVVFSRLVGPSGRVVCIEAHPHTYRCLEKTVRANGLSNVVHLNAAVATEAGEIMISDGTNYLSNSIQAFSDGGIPVRAHRLDQLMVEVGCSSIDLMKMNIEGAEVEALRSAGPLLGRTRHVVISCHDFKADRGESSQFRTYDRVGEILSNYGFSLYSRMEHPMPEVRYFHYGRRA